MVRDIKNITHGYSTSLPPAPCSAQILDPPSGNVLPAASLTALTVT